MKIKLFGTIAAILVLAGVFVAGSSAPTTADADEPTLPIVYVHGGAGSPAQYETQAMRWASNDYPNVVTGIDRTSSFPWILNPMLDAFFDGVMAETGDDQIYVIAHSLGTSLMVNYLNSSSERSARVAKYINIDGATGVDCPGNPAPVECLGIAANPARLMGPNNVHFPNQTHTQLVTSAESFVAQYEFLTGEEPVTTLVLPEPPGEVEIAGKVINFPANTGVDGATVELWEVHPATGARKYAEPHAVFNLGPSGEWGPVAVNGQKHYEFSVMRPDSENVAHYYRQPFLRDDYLIRLLSSSPSSPIIQLTEVGPDHAAAVLIRYKEWWGDAGASNDTLEINGVNVINDATSPRSNLTIGIHAFDLLSDKTTDVSAPIPDFFAMFFQTGVDVFMPASDPPDGTISFVNAPRGDTTRLQVVNTANWASEGHRILIQFNDYVQDINSWPECKQAKPSPCQ